METAIEHFRGEIRGLVEKFECGKYFYLSKQYHYLEAQARHDFIDPFFEALGWNLGMEEGLSPFEREVLLEKGETKGRPDYNFRIEGVSKFYVEAKAPSEPLDKTAHIMQAKSYAWNTKDVFIVVLTDFEEFKVFDASLKPDPRNPNLGLIYDFKYTDYLEKLDNLWTLSRDEVASGSLDKLLLKDAQSKRLRIPIDKSFLSDMTGWREELAKDLYTRNPDINVRMLNEVVQRILDRFVFIRIAEDRKIIEPKSLLELVELWKSEGKRRPLLYHLNILFRQINGDLNGEIFKYHACETYEFDSSLLAKIIEGLYFPKCPYRFEVIGVELLGSIYERYLGNTIRLTAKRVKVEEKPEVRKAGGVYYTPKYIVDYIVNNTVGKLIEGKTPEEIAEIKILDPACGSGSFLLGAYQKLIDYHIKYYIEHPAEAGRSTLFPDLIIDPGGSHRLSITKKAEILQNNIFGVDIDPQAVEVSMMSLYIKALEGERTLPQNKELLPSLADNIKCGNSLISYDIFEQQTLIEDEERNRINPFDWNSRKAGFGDIMEKGGFDCVIGNPPYVFGRDWKALNISDDIKAYLGARYKSSPYQLDMFSIFMEKASRLCRLRGYVGQIVPNVWLTNTYSSSTRAFILSQASDLCILTPPSNVFLGITVDTVVYTFQKTAQPGKSFQISAMQNGSILELATHNAEQYLDGLRPISTSLDSASSDLVFRLKKNYPTLQSFAKITRGVHPYRIGGYGQTAFGSGPQTSRDVKERPYHSKSKKKGYRPFIYGRDLRRFSPPISTEFVKYGPWLAEPRQSEFFQGERVYSRKILGKRLVVTLETTDSVADQQVYITLTKKNTVKAPYLAGILGSRLIAFFIRGFYDEINDAFPQIKVGQLKSLPIRTIDFSNPTEKAKHDKLVALVDRMLELNSKKNALPPSSERERIEREIAVTDERIDEMVYELYRLTKEEIRVVESE